MVLHAVKNLCDGYPYCCGKLIAILATCWPLGSMSGKDAQDSFENRICMLYLD